MLVELYALLSFLFGCAVTYLWMSARSRWQRGRGLLRQPDQVAAENAKRLQVAHSARAQGWRELRRSLVEIALAAVLVLVFGVVLSGVWG